MRSHKLFILNLLRNHLLELICLEQCDAFRDVYIDYLLSVQHELRKSST